MNSSKQDIDRLQRRVDRQIKKYEEKKRQSEADDGVGNGQDSASMEDNVESESEGEIAMGGQISEEDGEIAMGEQTQVREEHNGERSREGQDSVLCNEGCAEGCPSAAMAYGELIRENEQLRS